MRPQHTVTMTTRTKRQAFEAHRGWKSSRTTAIVFISLLFAVFLSHVTWDSGSSSRQITGKVRSDPSFVSSRAPFQALFARHKLSLPFDEYADYHQCLLFGQYRGGHSASLLIYYENNDAALAHGLDEGPYSRCEHASQRCPQDFEFF